MGCRCAERREDIADAGRAMVAGDAAGAAALLAKASRTLVEDARSGALRAAALQRLAQYRGRR